MVTPVAQGIMAGRAIFTRKKNLSLSVCVCLCWFIFIYCVAVSITRPDELSFLSYRLITLPWLAPLLMKSSLSPQHSPHWEENVRQAGGKKQA